MTEERDQFSIASNRFRTGAPITVDGLTVDPSRIDDLLCSALEGGSTYWCNGITVDDWPEGVEWKHETLTKGGIWYVKHEDGSEEIMGKHIPIALSLMAKDYTRHFADFMTENDDAVTGDVFLQLLCFGEVVYG